MTTARAKIFQTTKEIKVQNMDNSERVLAQGSMVVHRSNGSWRLTNSRPPVHVVIDPHDLPFLKDIDRETGDEYDWHDTN